jgi:hypothetical protein
MKRMRGGLLFLWVKSRVGGGFTSDYCGASIFLIKLFGFYPALFFINPPVTGNGT